MDYAARRDKLRKQFRRSGIEGLLVSNPTNVTYLTGFTGEDSLLLLSAENAVLLSDTRFTTQIEEECPGVDAHIRRAGERLHDAVGKIVGKAKLGRVGLEADHVTVSLLGSFEEHVSSAEWVRTSGLVERLREIKDKEEVQLLREAVRHAEKGFAVLRASLHAELTEKQVGDDLEHQLRQFGATGTSFPPIVAVGDRAALPHYRPGGRTMGEADFVLVDWGADTAHYKSDLTRVLVTGKISPKLERVYRVVLNAQLAGIAALRPGAIPHEVDQAARRVIEEAGFGKQFGHSLGHGIGLDIHEGPRLAPGSQEPLKAGMVVTIEPGIYLPGWGGVRIEDDVLVTRNGHEVLTSVEKELEQMVVA